MDTHFSFLFMFCSLISPWPKWGVTLDMNDFFQQYISAILLLFCDPVWWLAVPLNQRVEKKTNNERIILLILEFRTRTYSPQCGFWTPPADPIINTTQVKADWLMQHNLCQSSDILTQTLHKPCHGAWGTAVPGDQISPQDLWSRL